MAEYSGTKLNMLFNKVLGENEKDVFSFYLKKCFGQPNRFILISYFVN